MDVGLCKMTKQLMRQFLNGFTNDQELFEDMSQFSEYCYSEATADARWQRQRKLGRIHLAVMLNGNPIGEVILKNIQNNTATLSIHMKNNSVKNRGFGTQAEILTLDYAFGALKIQTVFADAIHKNKRSQHVLEKVGFHKTHCDDHFVYYRCDRATWDRMKYPDQSSSIDSIALS